MNMKTKGDISVGKLLLQRQYMVLFPIIYQVSCYRQNGCWLYAPIVGDAAKHRITDQNNQRRNLLAINVVTDFNEFNYLLLPQNSFSYSHVQPYDRVMRTNVVGILLDWTSKYLLLCLW